MNLVLFEPDEVDRPLRRADPRATHVLDVLRRKVGDTFDCGLVNGPRGKATLVAIEPDAIGLAFSWGPAPAPPPPITLIVGLPRPQTARDILRDATTIGVAAIHFVRTERTEPGYATSTLWTSGEWRRHLVAGAQQAFDTSLPAVTHEQALSTATRTAPRAAVRIALDHYEASSSLADFAIAAGDPVWVAIGPERGWTRRDRDELRADGFTLAHLGPRVLRTEAAVIASLTLARAKLGLFA